jgi:DNA-binding MarR family transcriptional regulator
VSDTGVEAPLFRLIDEVRALFHVLKAVAEQVHGEGELSAARRGVLLGLAKTGPQTVPEIARSRPVSRQHIQVVVNQLIEEGFAESIPNPAHRRSHLVRITKSGRAKVREIIARETAVFSRLEIGESEAKILRAAKTLEGIRGAFSRSVELC